MGDSVNFEPSEFNTLLNDMGQDVRWRRASACPCVSPSSGQPDPYCDHCAGKGRLWQGEVGARTGVAGGNVQKQWLNFGQYASGDIVVSVPEDSPLYDIGPFDRVLFLNRTEPFSQNVVKGVNERINFPVVELEKVLYLQGGQLVDAALPMINPDGSLDWSGVEVPDGVTFAITGRRRAEYFCLPDTPWDRPHHAGARLPRKVVLRRFDMLANS
jgi:hypothetical protein